MSYPLEVKEHPSLSERQIRLELFPGNEGVLAATTATPVLRAERVMVDLEQNRIQAEVDVNSITVVPEGLSWNEVRRIESLLKETLLRAREYPLITFESAPLDNVNIAKLGDSVVLSGLLTIRGVSKEVDLLFTRVDERTYACETVIRQTDYGIEPLRACMGAVCSKNDVPIHITVRL